jgi:ubiquinone/menaquinone biosynthesis C-methylase UbiE
MEDEYSRQWFDPRRLFEKGYPEGLSSALRVIPAVRRVVTQEVQALMPKLTLEIGPGDAPVTEGLAGEVVYLDIATSFLKKLPGMRVQANLLQMPFADKVFDLVVVSDVLTHIRPEDRERALAAMGRISHNVLVFNPEHGTGEVDESPVSTTAIEEYYRAHGFQVRTRQFVAHAVTGDYDMAIIRATPSLLP